MSHYTTRPPDRVCGARTIPETPPARIDRNRPVAYNANVMSFPLGIFSYTGYGLPLDTRLALIKDAGFEATSIWWGDEEDDYRRGFYRKMPDMVRDHGLYLEYVHVAFKYCDDLWSENASERERAVARHLDWIRDCAGNGIPIMVMHAIRGSYKGAINRHGMESIERIVRAGEDAGITIAVENTRRMDVLEPIFTEIDSPALGFCYDSSHERLCTEEAGALLRRCGDRLSCTHLSDCDGTLDRHWLPGDGIMDWRALMDAFPAETYRGCFSLEVVPGKAAADLSPSEFLAEAYKRANWLTSMITTNEEDLV